MIDIIRKLLMKNRTIVSRDNSECMDILCKRYPLKIHKYPTGNEYQTWLIPPEWNVRTAVLKDGDNVIASYDESKLFLSPYSLPFAGFVSKDELMEHTLSNLDIPDAFCYEHRLAYNFQRRLKEWRISLPYERLRALSKGPFQVEIDVDIRPGNMLVGEYAHPGCTGNWFVFLAHYCHIAQANDGIAGVAVMLETMDRIVKSRPCPRHGYKALLMPETIGSSVYAATHEEEIDATLGAVFSEMPGADEGYQFVFSRRGDTYIDRVFLHVLRKQGRLPCRFVPFREGWGNDELIYDSPGVGVPTVSMDRHPYAAYHTHHDDLSLVRVERLEEIVEVLTDVVDVLEEDFIPRPNNRVPAYLSRYGLYADWTHQRDQYDTNMRLLDSMWSGLSVLDIALKHDLEFESVRPYMQKFVEQNLIGSISVTPEYCRSVRFLPSFSRE